jgi:hypothetical protein
MVMRTRGTDDDARVHVPARRASAGPRERAPRGATALARACGLTAALALLTAAVAQPSARGYVDMVYVKQVGKVLLFGGQALSTPPYTMLGETWWWDPVGGTWEQVTTEPQPSVRGAAHIDVHAPSGTVVMFGGGVPVEGGFHAYSETWLFDPVAERWSLMEPDDGIGPTASIGEMFAYHPGSDRFVLHGGLSLSPFAFLDHTWHLDLAARRWTRVESAIRPIGRNYNAFAYDPRSDRLVMTGGPPEGSDETWTYDPRDATWTHVARAGAGPAVPYARMAFDEASGTLVRYGGVDDHADVAWSIDADGSTWTPLAVTGEGPGGLSRFAMTAVPEVGIVAFGGLYPDAGAFHADLWVLDARDGRWQRR